MISASVLSGLIEDSKPRRLDFMICILFIMAIPGQGIAL